MSNEIKEQLEARVEELEAQRDEVDEKIKEVQKQIHALDPIPCPDCGSTAPMTERTIFPLPDENGKYQEEDVFWCKQCGTTMKWEDYREEMVAKPV